MSTRYLTTGEVGRFCGVHFRTVIRWIDKGRLKAHKLPGGRGDNRIALDDFLAFLHANAMPVPAELRPDNRRVLIVDDEENMARGLQRILRRAGFEARVALDGLRAGVELKSFHPAVLTLDLMMPGIDGFEVLRFLHERPELSDIRVLVVSALDRSELDRALAAGADAALAKPFDAEQLVAEVEGLIERGARLPADGKSAAGR